MLTHFTWHKFSSRNVLFIQQNYLQTRIFTAVNRACLRKFVPNIRDIGVNAMLMRKSYADVINCEVRSIVALEIKQMNRTDMITLTIFFSHYCWSKAIEF